MNNIDAFIQRNEVRDGITDLLPALQKFACRLARFECDREDLVQETIWRALRSQHLFRPGTALKTWLFTIMRNTFNTEYKRRRREVVGIDDGYVNVVGCDGAQEWAVRQTELSAALERLPEESRNTLLLVASGTSYIETARLCGCEVGTVKSRVNRARKVLEDEIGTSA
ncbi:sigma-70 family RNA polymerase sigma factor [Ensifer sp. 4252]|uniref:sigma-70 family RNA polymerase sigma factor n=1 Tax=Ensifer sp. 4252 TaxID=3373915 RepID=UPI003D1BBCAA